MITCLKQYGEKRTGTNYVRELMLANYPDVTLLMHVLGDKHSPPVDFAHLLQRASGAPDPDVEFVRAATFAAPAESTRPGDPEQIVYLENVARRVAASFREASLGFVICAKNPYAWAASLARYSGWMVWHPDGPRMHPLCGDALAAACREYNRKYRAWIDLHSRFESRSIIIRHEDLVDNTAEVLRKMERRLGLASAHPGPVIVGRGVLPTDWDHCETRLHRGEFDSRFYRGRGYARELSPALWRRVEENIDWAIAAELDYKKSCQIHN